MVEEDLAFRTLDAAAARFGRIRRGAGGSQAVSYACQGPKTIADLGWSGVHLGDAGLSWPSRRDCPLRDPWRSSSLVGPTELIGAAVPVGRLAR